MGGRGSGNWWRSGRATCESYSAISISYLRANDLLRPGRSATLTWSRCGEVTGSIHVEFLPAGLLLVYRTQRHNEETWTDIREIIPWAASDQHFGGRRLWFSCLSCQKRCGVLYGGRHYRCRKCWNLAYESQREDFPMPNTKRADTIRRRLGGKPDQRASLPARPKGMHHQTYWRLCDEYIRIEEARAESFAARVQRLLS